MDYRFAALLGAPYRGGNLLIHGNELLTPVGNRVTQVRPCRLPPPPPPPPLRRCCRQPAPACPFPRLTRGTARTRPVPPPDQPHGVVQQHTAV